MSGRKRFFIDSIAPEQKQIVLEGEEFVHATVQRIDVGCEITLLDGSGKEYTAIVARVEKRSILANIISEKVGDKEPNEKIYLLCGAIKGDKTELVVQKAVELGVEKIGIFNSEFCASFINDNKVERLNKVSKEGAKQCLRSCSPQVVYFDKFEDALKSASGYRNKIFANEHATTSKTDILKIEGSTALLVGSEGGFSLEECEKAQKAGFTSITLGKRILRAETAAIALTAIVSCVLGELK